MGWTHIFADVGKFALQGADIAGKTIGGPLGTAIQIGSNIGLAELKHPPKSGEAKAAEVQAAALSSPGIQASPVEPATKVELIRSIIDSIVAILKALGELFPAKPEPTPPPTA